ncbi:sigma-70 family RNA polymerase sigma factor [Sphingomonas sp. SUN019]|uniref:RNA polymerase sigma factor n=1 Tax=Sphingomonas sp. SUN019 TaxID=2937788 RepID=UPI0021648372|nr:sigma-70 family RNA polymerase sigma factor [Sphingomonas sp. SUN019]UVO50152.1 sigma-70 family RNA polymerase sigma factor [Sphingomonas sp. SUN019]
MRASTALCASDVCFQASRPRAAKATIAVSTVVDGANRARVPRATTWLSDLFRAEQPRLARYLRRRIHDADEAADLLQEAFARLASVRHPIPLRRPEAYLQRIVRNLIVDRTRRRGPRGLDHVALDDCTLPIVPPEQEHAIKAQDLMRCYRAALDGLTPRTREVFLLHRVEETTYVDIARRLGISVATVEYHMTRALIHLDEALGE